jgi:hypothetical protein
MIQTFPMSAALPRTLSSTAPLTLGRYRISACTDRVMRFTEDFPTHEAAASYAMAQGIDWVRDAARPALYPN